MTKRILLIFFVFAAMILPASAATKSHQHKHSAARGKSKSKAVRKSTHRSGKPAASHKRVAKTRAASH